MQSLSLLVAVFAQSVYATSSGFCTGPSLHLRMVIPSEKQEILEIEVYVDRSTVAHYDASEIETVEIDLDAGTVKAHSVSAAANPDLEIQIEDGAGSIRFRGKQEHVSCDLRQ